MNATSPCTNVRRLGLGGAVALLVVAALAPPAPGRSPVPSCRKTCRSRIAECAQADRRRKCRRSILRACRRQGIAYCTATTTTTLPRFSVRIDPGIAPPDPTTSTGLPLAAVAGDGGRPVVFVADELGVAPRDRAELDALLARTGGRVLMDDGAPPRPDGQPIPPELAAPTAYLIQVDPASADLATFAADAERAGLEGSFAVSSEAGAKLLALATHETANGVRVGPNFVFQGSYLSGTEEHPLQGGGYLDAFATPQFGPTGSRSNVLKAWQLVAAKPPNRRARVAIIDGGFWLFQLGGPMSVLQNGASDLPSDPLRYAFSCGLFNAVACGSGPNAAGPNPMKCSGGSTCNWHGNGAAGVALGILGNRYGAAGTGGLVADPILLKVDGIGGSGAAAVRTATAWGADVISMSLGGECDNSFCDLGFEAVGLYPALREAAERGVVVVAAAGNDALDTHSVPCRGDHVICVGALANGVNTPKPYSNYGRFVDIWAPTDIPVMPDGDNPNVHAFGGTNASTPFVAGVAAMLKAYDANLGADDVDAILYQTAWHDSPDPKVGAYVNAYAAVRQVAGGAPPELRVLAPVPNATVDINTLGGVPFRAQTNDLEDGPDCCTVRWTSFKDGPMGEGHTINFQFPDLGVRLISAEAENASGVSTFVNFAINVVESPPDVVIDQPASGAHLYEDTPVTLSGRVLGGSCSAENGHWSSNGQADEVPQAGCTVLAKFHGTGARTLTLSVTGPHGTPGSVGVNVTIDPKPAVVASILAPTTGDAINVDNCDDAFFEAYATGASPLTFTWTWQADQQGCAPFTITTSCPPFNVICTTQPPPDTYPSFWHSCGPPAPPCIGTGKIQLQVTDALDQTAMDEVAVSLVVNPH